MILSTIIRFSYHGVINNNELKHTHINYVMELVCNDKTNNNYFLTIVLIIIFLIIV